MSDFSKSTITIEAPLAEVEKTIFAIAKFPQWSTAIKSVEVLASDGQGRVTQAKLVIDAGMLKDRVVLDYDWSGAPSTLAFSFNDADLLTAMDGSYSIKALDESSTEVTYELEVGISMPIPAMMRKKAEKATIDLALTQLKTYLEG